MKVNLAYGRDGLSVELPDETRVVTPVEQPALVDEHGAIREAVLRPVAGPGLSELVQRGMTVAIVFPDITRPMPNKTVLPPLAEELEHLGVSPADVTLLCATGTHRSATHEEMLELIGPDLLSRYQVHQHVAEDGDHVEVGTVDGTAVLIDRRYVDADLRILTGFVEPHFFAGFSGGPKGVCPGLAALSTTLEAHSPARIGSPSATWTELDLNPVHQFVTAAASLAPPDLSVDVAINGARRVTAVFAGPLPSAHRQACRFVEKTSVRRLGQQFDVVVTTNAGFPLDRNLYQAVKGMAAAERIVRPGGTIIAAASCVDGMPPEGDFGALVRAAQSPADLVDPGERASLDSWQVQVLGRVLMKARVQLFCEGLTPDEVRAAHLEPIEDVSSAVWRACESDGTSVCALPEGPLTVASTAALDAS